MNTYKKYYLNYSDIRNKNISVDIKQEILNKTERHQKRNVS